jgi:hypothetical protein
MRSATLKSKGVALAAALLPALALAACGGSSNSGGGNGFAAKANQACAAYSSANGAIHETIGEQYKANTASWAAGTTAGDMVATQHEIAALKGLRPGAGQAATYKTYIGDLQQIAALLGQEKTAAVNGDATAFHQVDAQLGTLDQATKKVAAQLGLSSCAGNGLAAADKATITNLVTTTQETNSPTQCTQDFTAAFIKEAYGSMAACLAAGKQPVGPGNAKTVNVTSIDGAGDFAVVQATAQDVSGKTVNVTAGVYRQNGTWRLVGFSSH